MLSKRLWLVCALSMALSLSLPGAFAADPSGVPVTYQLPTDGPLPKTYRVTLAVTPADEADWIVSTFVAGEPRTVTEDNQGRFTDYWSGLDENDMPAPPGAYAVKGIYMPAEVWGMDGRHHSLTARYVLAAGDSWAPLPERDDRFPWIFGHAFGNVVDVQAGPEGRAGFLASYAATRQKDSTTSMGMAHPPWPWDVHTRTDTTRSTQTTASATWVSLSSTRDRPVRKCAGCTGRESVHDRAISSAGTSRFRTTGTGTVFETLRPSRLSVIPKTQMKTPHTGTMLVFSTETEDILLRTWVPEVPPQAALHSVARLPDFDDDGRDGFVIGAPIRKALCIGMVNRKPLTHLALSRGKHVPAAPCYFCGPLAEPSHRSGAPQAVTGARQNAPHPGHSLGKDDLRRAERPPP